MERRLKERTADWATTKWVTDDGATTDNLVNVTSRKASKDWINEEEEKSEVILCIPVIEEHKEEELVNNDFVDI